MNNLATARNAFMQDAKNEPLFDNRTVTHEYYLRNRLETAFCAGWNACATQYGIIEPSGVTDPFEPKETPC